MKLWLVGLARLLNFWKLWNQISSHKLVATKQSRLKSDRLQDLRHAMLQECAPKNKIKNVQELYENALWTNGMLDQRIIDKATGERWKRLWAGEGSLTIRCQHFLLLTFCHVLFLNSRLWLFAGWLKCASCATMHNYISTTLYKNI